MNQVVTQPQAERRASPVEAYTAQVMGDERTSADLFGALPSHIPPARFKRNLVNLLMQKPEMMRYDARLVFREVSKAAALGLLLDPHLGEAYVVPVWNGQAKRQEPQLRIGYRGIIKLARQSGEISNIYADEVCEFDKFISEKGTDPRLEHRPDYSKPRGKPICYYAVVRYKDGTHDFEVMSIEEIHRIRDRSDAYKAFMAGKISTTPWDTDEGEMGKKTVLRRLGKRMPQCSDLADALGHESAADQLAQTIDLTAAPRPAPAPQKTIEHRLDAFASDEAPISQEPATPKADAPSDPEAGAVAPVADPPEASPAPSQTELTAGTDGAGDAELLPEALRDAMKRGRDAHGSGMPREVPKIYNYKTKQAEQDAFLKGWDDAKAKADVEQFGTV